MIIVERLSVIFESVHRMFDRGKEFRVIQRVYYSWGDCEFCWGLTHCCSVFQDVCVIVRGINGGNLVYKLVFILEFRLDSLFMDYIRLVFTTGYNDGNSQRSVQTLRSYSESDYLGRIPVDKDIHGDNWLLLLKKVLFRLVKPLVSVIYYSRMSSYLSSLSLTSEFYGRLVIQDRVLTEINLYIWRCLHTLHHGWYFHSFCNQLMSIYKYTSTWYCHMCHNFI